MIEAGEILQQAGSLSEFTVVRHGKSRLKTLSRLTSPFSPRHLFLQRALQSACMITNPSIVIYDPICSVYGDSVFQSLVLAV